MFKSVMTGAVYGVSGRLITVEADVSNGFPGFTMVGYLASEVREAKERVLTAIKNTGMSIPPKRMIVNMSPADIRKQGTVFDLAIALAMMAAMGGVSDRQFDDMMFAGELGLSGAVIGVRGVIALALLAKERHIGRLMVPFENKREAEAVSGIEVIGVHTLSEAVVYLNNGKLPKDAGDFAACREGSMVLPEDTAGSLVLKTVLSEKGAQTGCDDDSLSYDFSMLLGQERLKRAIAISVAGGHHLLISGPPGVGKSLASKCIPSVLSPLSDEESMEVTRIHSVAGLIPAGSALVQKRPFRAPHHSASVQALVGGGHIPVPGEVSLAHRGILFLDELTEFNRQTIEALRQPLEDGAVTISRVQGNYTFPAQFTLVAAINPCPCGYFPDRTKCRCTQKQIKTYLNRLSRPVLDRFDMTIEASPIKYEDMKLSGGGMSSAQLRASIGHARRMQKDRFQNDTMTNARMNGELLKKFCSPDSRTEKFLKTIYKKEDMSTRGYCKLLRTARTAADMDSSDKVLEQHIYEALSYRTFDKSYWGNL